MSIDAAGAMTGTFCVRDDGRLVAGKRQGTPVGESLAILDCSEDVLAHCGCSADEAYP